MDGLPNVNIALDGETMDVSVRIIQFDVVAFHVFECVQLWYGDWLLLVWCRVSGNTWWCDDGSKFQ
jgi:hypothetical protein